MAKIPASNNLSNIKSVEDVVRYFSIFVGDVFDIVNGKIEFDSNIQSKTIDFNFTSANTNFAMIHGLGKIPKGYLLIKSNVATSIYDGSIDATEKLIYLKSSQIATTRLLIF